jgi:hypothetical protein
MTIKMPSSVKPANTDKKAEAFIAGAAAAPRVAAPPEDEGRGKKVLNEADRRRRQEAGH